MANNINNKDTIHEADVVVVGAGLIGLAAAIALHAEGKRVMLVDSKKESAERKTKVWDTRIYALTPATQDWLQSAGVWPLVNNDRVSHVRGMSLWNDVAQEALNLEAEDANLSELAYIIENKNLMQALWQKVKSTKVPVIAGSPCQDVVYDGDGIELRLESGDKVSAALLIAADGANSFVRQKLAVATNSKSFDQIALVANYLTEKSHRNIARQWFAAHNTLALLPLPEQHVSMVWSVSTELAEELLSMSELALASRVQAHSRDVLGQLKPVSNTLSFGLSQDTAHKLITNRVAFVGDAAHRVHPMAGQGANLGFRDVITLQAIIADSHTMQDIGELSFLRQYERSRKADIVSMNALTSGLDNLFASKQSVVTNMAVWGMGQLNKHPSMKSILIKQAVA